MPVYNEEKAIRQVVEGVDETMRKTQHEYEILLVDDASSDKTTEIIEKMQKENARINLVKRKINGGAGASRKTGIRVAKGGIVVMLDADGTYDHTDIPKMLKYFPEYDQVNGARTSEEGTYKLLRFSAKFFIRKMAIYLTGYKIPDLNTGLKAFKKDIMMKYLWVIPDGFSCVTTMTLAFFTNGHSVKYIPTKYFKRIGKSKFHPIKDTLKYFNTVLRMVVYFKPLKFFMPIAGIIFVVAVARIVYGLYNIEFKIRASELIMVMTAIQVFIAGFIADLIVSTTKRDR